MNVVVASAGSAETHKAGHCWPVPAEFKIVALRECAFEPPSCDTPEQGAAFWRAHVPASPRFNAEVENLCVIFVNTRRRIIGFEVVSQGILDTLLVHPREVFRGAILANASGIVVTHNHPSGDPSPSDMDIKVTRDLIRAGLLLKVDLLDHIILGHARAANGKGYVSLRDLGYFYQ